MQFIDGFCLLLLDSKHKESDIKMLKMLKTLIVHIAELK